MRKLCPVIATLLVLFVIPLYSSSSAVDAPSYIERFKDIAIQEMHRSGIPASITLAQAIHESAWGNGTLAMKSNNYFGIKCKDYWAGPTYYIEDDDYENGKLMKSCFRAYDKIEDSFKDHSDFLRDNPRYNMLFALDAMDYEGWAKGLQKCGYATDKLYAQKIIKKIEQYKLHQYDTTPATRQEIAMADVAPAPAIAPVFNISGYTTASVESAAPPVPDNTPIAPLSNIAEETYEVPDAFALPDDYERGANREAPAHREPLYLGTTTTTTIPTVDFSSEPTYEILAPVSAPVQEAPPAPQPATLPVPAPVYQPPSAPSPKQAEAIIRMTYASDGKSSQLSRRPRVSNNGRR